MECSIILSAYCGKKYLAAQLDSILKQSRMPEEIILIDDCSIDNGETEQIIDDYAARFSNVKKHKNSENMGWAASFMNGINLATKDVVFFSDQDDIWDEKKVELMMNVMENNNINALISDCQNVDESLVPIGSHNNSGKLLNNKFPFGRDFINPKGVGAAMVFRLDFLRKYTVLWNPTIGHDRFYQIMAVCFDTIYYLDISLICHRFHEENATGVARRNFNAQGRIESIKGNIQLVNDMRKSTLWESLSKERKKIVENYIQFGNARKDMLESKSFIKWLGLIRYGMGYYPTKKTWFGDLKCIL